MNTFPYPHYDYRPRLGPFLLGPNTEPENGVYCGDFFQYADRIPDNSIDLCFTDPVYWQIDDYRRLAEVCSRVLKPGGDLLVYFAMYHLDKTIAALTEHLAFRWLLTEKKIGGNTLIHHYGLFAHTVPILWFTKGEPKRIYGRIDFMWSKPNAKQKNHQWNKGTHNIDYWLNKFGAPGDIILDPFCGGGGIVSSFVRNNSKYLAFEIDRATAQTARDRVRNTNPPLFTLPPQQAKLEFAAD